MKPLFIATERFGASEGERWKSYYEWAQIPNLVEVVSLDSILCPCLVTELVDEDWKHNVHEDSLLEFFYDLDYLLTRVANVSRRNILGLYRNPDTHIEVAPAPGRFVFVGYDLFDDAQSALVNCGGFPETFSNGELNKYGLISDFSRAREIRRVLPERNPGEHHALCEVYAIWRLVED